MEPFKAAVILCLVTAFNGGRSEFHGELESQKFENSRSLHIHSIRKRDIGDGDETSQETDNYQDTVGQDEIYDQTTDAFYQNLDYTGDIIQSDTETSDDTFENAGGEQYTDPSQMLSDDYPTTAYDQGDGNENGDDIYYNNYDQTMDAQQSDYGGDYTEGDVGTSEGTLGITGDETYDYSSLTSTQGGVSDSGLDEGVGTGSDSGDGQQCNKCGGKDDSADEASSDSNDRGNDNSDSDGGRNDSGERKSCNKCGGKDDSANEASSDSNNKGNDNSDSDGGRNDSGERKSCNKCGGEGGGSEGEADSNSDDRGGKDSGGDNTNSDSGDEQDCSKCEREGDKTGERSNSDSTGERNDSGDRKGCKRCGGELKTTDDVTESDSSDEGDSHSGHRISSSSGDKRDCNKCGGEGGSSEREADSISDNRDGSDSGGDNADSNSEDGQDCSKCRGTGGKTRSDSDDGGNADSNSDEERKDCNKCGGKRETTDDLTKSDSSIRDASYSADRTSSNSGEKRNCNKCVRKGGSSNSDDRGGSDSRGDDTDSDSGDEQDCSKCWDKGGKSGDGTYSDSDDEDRSNSYNSGKDSKDVEQVESGMKMAETIMNDHRKDSIDNSYNNVPGSISSSTSQLISLDTRDRFKKESTGIPIRPDSSWQNPSSSIITNPKNSENSQNIVKQLENYYDAGIITGSSDGGIGGLMSSGRGTGFENGKDTSSHSSNTIDTGMTSVFSSSVAVSPVSDSTGGNVNILISEKTSKNQEPIVDSASSYVDNSKSSGGFVDLSIKGKAVERSNQGTDPFMKTSDNIPKTVQNIPATSWKDSTLDTSSTFSEKTQGIPVQPDNSYDTGVTSDSSAGSVGLSVDSYYGPVETIHSEQVNYIPASPYSTFIKSEQTPGLESTSVLTSLPSEPLTSNFVEPSVPGGSIVESNTQNADQYVPKQEPQGLNLNNYQDSGTVQGVPSTAESTISESLGGNVNPIVIDTLSQNLEQTVGSTADNNIPASSGGYTDLSLNGKVVETSKQVENFFMENNGGNQGPTDVTWQNPSTNQELYTSQANQGVPVDSSTTYVDSVSPGGYTDMSFNNNVMEVQQPRGNTVEESSVGVPVQTDVSWQSPSTNPDLYTSQTNQGVPVDSSATYIDNSVSPGGYTDMSFNNNVMEVQQPRGNTVKESSVGVPVQTDVSWQSPSTNQEFKTSLRSQGIPVDSSATYVDNSAGGYVDMSLKSKVVEASQPSGSTIVKSSSGVPVQTDFSWQKPTVNADYKTSGVFRGNSIQTVSSRQGSSTITGSGGFVDLSLKGKGKLAKENQQVQGIAVGNYVKEPYEVKSWSYSTKSKGTDIGIPDGAIDIAGRIEQQMGSTASRYQLNREPQAFINEPQVVTVNSATMKKKPSKIFLAITSKIREADGSSAYQYLKDEVKQVENPGGGYIKIYRNQPGGSKEMERVYVNFRQPSAVVKKTFTRTVDIPGNKTRMFNTGQSGSVTINVGGQTNNGINVRHSSPVVRESTFTRTVNMPSMRRRVFNTGGDGSVSIGFGSQTNNTAESNGASSRLTGSMSLNNIGVQDGHDHSNFGHVTHTTYVEGQPLFGTVSGKVINIGGAKVQSDHGHAHGEHTVNGAEVSLPTGHFHVHSNGGRHIVHTQRHENVNEDTYKKVMDIINRRKAMKSGSVSIPIDSSISTIRRVETQVGANSGLGESSDRKFNSRSFQFKEVSLPTSSFHVHTAGNRHIVHNQKNEIVDPTRYKSVMDMMKRRPSRFTSRPFASSFSTSGSATENVGVTGIPIRI
ncbi:uncharacterized protein LOC134273384 [Saccostrea cucullata]|uniref:uncharacterized protein LOC134273384 n=1 Tax=Saccostrea cuccullata TaxID=36930 RepID=UPI002ED3D06D